MSRAKEIVQEIIETIIMGTNALGVATPIIMPIIMALRKKLPDDVKQEWPESRIVDFVRNFQKEQDVILSEFDKRRKDDPEEGNDNDEA